MTVDTNMHDATTGGQIVAWARPWIGSRGYSEGSSSRFRGVTRADCSAFVNAAVYAVTGQYIGSKDSWTGSQMSWLKAQGLWLGGGDAWKSAQPGDVVYYSGHVALYEGNGRVISNGGDPVQEHAADYRPVLGIGRTSTLPARGGLELVSNTTAGTSAPAGVWSLLPTLPEGWATGAMLGSVAAVLLLGALAALMVPGQDFQRGFLDSTIGEGAGDGSPKA